MSGPRVQNVAPAFKVEQLRCECGAVMNFTRNWDPDRGHEHRCTRDGCAKVEWLAKAFPRLLVYDADSLLGADPLFIINADQVDYS